MQIERQAFFKPDYIVGIVQKKVAAAQEAGESIDYLTFVSDGEPTLDANLLKTISMLRPLGIKIAVITNASLINRQAVQQALLAADWVSVKVDSVQPDIWRKVDRPHGGLQLPQILDGLQTFARQFQGKLVIETMLVNGVNDTANSVEQTAQFVARLNPHTAYLAIPTRPPAEAWVLPPTEESIMRAYRIFSRFANNVEYLIGYEGNAFACTGNVSRDLLDITAVHPMREDAVDEFLVRAEADWSVVERLIAQERLLETTYKDQKFYMRKLTSRPT